MPEQDGNLEKQKGLSGRLPVLRLAFVAVLGAVLAVLALVGAGDVDQLTRGEPWWTFLGASLAVLAVVASTVAVAVGAVAKARGWIELGAWTALFVGFTAYLVAGVRVNTDPAAPLIKVATRTDTHETEVTVTADTLAFNERLHVRARFRGFKHDFARAVIGAGRDGKVSHKVTIGPQSASRRLQVTAQVLRAKQIPQDVECNRQEAGRLCAELGHDLPRGLPSIAAKVTGEDLRVSVADKGRIPGIMGLRIYRRDREIYAARVRAQAAPYADSIKLARRPKGASSDVLCIVASYGRDLPTCPALDVTGKRPKEDPAIAVLRFKVARTASGRMRRAT